LQALSVQRLRGRSRLTRNILAQGGLDIMTLELKPLLDIGLKRFSSGLSDWRMND